MMGHISAAGRSADAPTVGIPPTAMGDAEGAADHPDWERFYALCDGTIRGALAARRLQAADREDCSQEIWLELVGTRMSRFRGGDIRAWLATLARNKAIDAIRRGRRRPVGLTIDPGARAASHADTSCPTDELRSMVWSALAQLEQQLEPRSFLVFFLRWIEGWSFAEIADELGLTAGQARLRHFRAKEKFRGVIEGRTPA